MVQAYSCHRHHEHTYLKPVKIGILTKSQQQAKILTKQQSIYPCLQHIYDIQSQTGVMHWNKQQLLTSHQNERITIDIKWSAWHKQLSFLSCYSMYLNDFVQGLADHSRGMLARQTNNLRQLLKGNIKAHQLQLLLNQI